MLPRLLSRFVLADPIAEKNFLPHLLTPFKGTQSLICIWIFLWRNFISNFFFLLWFFISLQGYYNKLTPNLLNRCLIFGHSFEFLVQCEPHSLFTFSFPSCSLCVGSKPAMSPSIAPNYYRVTITIIKPKSFVLHVVQFGKVLKRNSCNALRFFWIFTSLGTAYSKQETGSDKQILYIWKYTISKIKNFWAKTSLEFPSSWEYVSRRDKRRMFLERM